MEINVTIFPSSIIPLDLSWEKIHSAYSNYFQDTNLIFPKEYSSFHILLTDIELGRLIVKNLTDLLLAKPSRIQKFVSSKPDKPHTEDDHQDRFVELRYIFDQKIEFEDSYDLILWQLDYGIKGLYEINEEYLYDVPLKKLDPDLLKKHRRDLNDLGFVVKMETDISSPKFNPILILAIIFCELFNGVALVEHSLEDYFLPVGYYTLDDLKKVLEATADLK